MGLMGNSLPRNFTHQGKKLKIFQAKFKNKHFETVVLSLMLSKIQRKEKKILRKRDPNSAFQPLGMQRTEDIGGPI